MTATTAKVRERPVLFSGAMVKAILSGAKTQTRRVVKLPDDGFTDAVRIIDPSNGEMFWRFSLSSGGACQSRDIECPYGPGDLLWGREAFYADKRDHLLSNPRIGKRETWLWRYPLHDARSEADYTGIGDCKP